MNSNSKHRCNIQARHYNRAESVVFAKTKEHFGGLSNMACGFPLCVNSVYISTAEALYQSCRFPRSVETQRLIILQKSPMTAKMKSKPCRNKTRSDWKRVRVDVMRWCLRVKLVQNWTGFSNLLLATEDRHIVEQSHRDDYWGAKPVDENTLVGMNVLGRLLMELRAEIQKGDCVPLPHVPPPSIPEFLLYGHPIKSVSADATKAKSETAQISHQAHNELFDAPAIQAKSVE